MKYSILKSMLFYYLFVPFLMLFNTSCKDDVSSKELVQEIIDSEISGCIDAYATNYDESVLFSNNTCVYNNVSCSGCDYIVENTETVLNNEELNLKPGSVIGIRGGDREPLTLLNFQGEEGDGTFIFTNCDGKALFSQNETSEAVRIRNSSFLRFTGTGSSDDFGIEITTGAFGIHGYEQVSDIEIDHVKIANVSGIALWIVTRPTCDGTSSYGQFEQRNTIIHHNYIADVHGEGMYIGPSKWDVGFSSDACEDADGVKLKQADLKGVEIYNNLVERTGWDGIQVGGAIENCKVYKNVIRDYGLEEVTIHQAGLMINPGTVGEFYANHIEGGTGNAIHVLGFDNFIHSNLIVDCALNAIHTGDREALEGKSYRIINNTIVNVGGKALNMNSKVSVNNVFSNNFMANIADEEFYFNNKENTTVTNNIMTTSLDDFLFVDPTNLNYTPTLESVLLDSGEVYDRDDMIVDYNMNYRLAGADLDIGAFENQEVSEESEDDE